MQVTDADGPALKRIRVFLLHPETFQPYRRYNEHLQFTSFNTTFLGHFVFVGIALKCNLKNYLYFIANNFKIFQFPSNFSSHLLPSELSHCSLNNQVLSGLQQDDSRIHSKMWFMLVVWCQLLSLSRYRKAAKTRLPSLGRCFNADLSHF